MAPDDIAGAKERVRALAPNGIVYVIDEQGNVDVPTGPGLGVTYNWELIERNKTGFVEYK